MTEEKDSVKGEGHHKHLQVVTVTDATSAPKEFVGELLGPAPEGDDLQWVRVNITDADNGFNWPVGVTLQRLKHLGDGRYGA